jgi:hypothetical protein
MLSCAREWSLLFWLPAVFDGSSDGSGPKALIATAGFDKFCVRWQEFFASDKVPRIASLRGTS